MSDQLIALLATDLFFSIKLYRLFQAIHTEVLKKYMEMHIIKNTQFKNVIAK